MILTAQALVDKARELAYIAHAGETRADKVTPYIVHPEDVANRFAERYVHLKGQEDWYRGIALGWVHDVRESRRDWTSQHLSDYGLESIVPEANLLTNDEGLSYLDYVLRLRASGNWIAIGLKHCDFDSNESTLHLVPSKGRAKAMATKWALARYILDHP